MSEEIGKLAIAVVKSRRTFRLLASGQVDLKNLIEVASDALKSIDQNLGISDERLNEIVQQYMSERHQSTQKV